MILKNEQDWVVGALESVRSIVDEVIIVDTGSTDETLDRVRPFDPIIIKRPWTEHFAEARNISLDAAGFDWILVLDADERIAGRDLPAVRRAIELNADGFHLVQRNYTYGNQVVGWSANTTDYAEGHGYPGYVDNPLIRLFRNDPELRFHGAVHEIIDPSRLPRKFRFESLAAPIHHYGKVRGEDRVKAKQWLYLELGRKKLQEDPSNVKAHIDLGIQLQELDLHGEARDWFARAHQMGAPPATLLYWAISEKRMGENERAAELLRKARAAGLKLAELDIEYGNVLLALGKPEDAAREYRRALSGQPDNALAVFNLGLAMKKTGDTVSAEAFYRRALLIDPSFVEAALDLAALLESLGQHIAAVETLQRLFERKPGSRRARLALAKSYIQAGRSAEVPVLLTDLAAEDPTAESLLGAALLSLGDIEEARARLESCLRKDRSLVDARINLGYACVRSGDYARASRHLRCAYEQTKDTHVLEAIAECEARSGFLQSPHPALSRHPFPGGEGLRSTHEDRVL